MRPFREMLTAQKEASVKIHAMYLWKETWFFCCLASAKCKGIMQNSALEQLLWFQRNSQQLYHHWNSPTGTKCSVISVSSHFIASYFHSPTFKVHSSSIHQGYKRFYPPATWQVSGTIDPRAYGYSPSLIMDRSFIQSIAAYGVP